MYEKANHQNRSKENVIANLKQIPFWLSLSALLIIFFDLGFDQSIQFQHAIHWGYITVFIFGAVSITGRYFFPRERPPAKVWPVDFILLLFLVALVLNFLKWFDFPYLGNHRWLYLGIFLVFVREFSALNINFKKQYFNPAQLFILSFIAIIFSGTVLIMLPNATYTGISFIDALFTSTSAVCVTGLVVVDTGTYFTSLGQTLILILIQVGGLGIMTFTSYFTYFFKGSSTFETQYLLKDIASTERISEVFSTLKRIVLLTFFIEAIGAILIYISLDGTRFTSVSDRTFFSIFHTVSGFCNAGFSTLSNSLYETGFRFNYPFHLTIAGLFIIGGIGFPICSNFIKYLKHVVIRFFFRSAWKKDPFHLPWILTINTRIVLITTLILIVFGTIFFYLFEYNNTLSEHNGFGKIVTAFFGAVTPRTAGFNTVNTSALNFSTIMFVFLLMWIGASPASTGGGIKTSTFAIATLNYINLARGKNRIEMFNREIADTSIRRAFAIVSLSLAVIGAAVFFISFFDSDKDLLNIAFECFSAYSTVGLSLGITGSLSNASKMVIILTMFIGRVSMLTILIALLRKVKHLKYRYPTEEILIN